ncbi:MAG: hypothetical protein JAY90_20260 [Candidatus Thiodiazotropha lotti]|nr:hypothetical protein [Candidatus Thiodiazotropha weberae]MCG7985070.1 hypothetical protein [Candidatus Thiodiazotropha lotti]
MSNPESALDDLNKRVSALEKRLEDMAIAKQPRLPTIIYPDPKTKFVAKLAEEFGIK